MADIFGKPKPQRFPVQEQVEEKLRRGAFAALKAVFSPGVEVAPETQFPYRADVEVIPIEGEPGKFWQSITIFERGKILTDFAAPERACLVVSGDDTGVVVEATCFAVKGMRDRHLGQRKSKL